MTGAALGPGFTRAEISDWLERLHLTARPVPDDAALLTEVARRLAAGQNIGWFDGRMEFGPRSLGHRSILADPRDPRKQAELNMRVKGREGFRPFAPAVPWENAREWFDIDRPSPYMLRTVRVLPRHLVPVPEEPSSIGERSRVPRSAIPACTHVDGSARVQTVDGAEKPRFHALLTEFGRITGCPVLVNTSFNIADEPIVCTPDDALRTARAASLDALVIEGFLIDSRDFG